LPKAVKAELLWSRQWLAKPCVLFENANNFGSEDMLAIRAEPPFTTEEKFVPALLKLDNWLNSTDYLRQDYL